MGKVVEALHVSEDCQSERDSVDGIKHGLGAQTHKAESSDGVTAKPSRELMPKYTHR